jgi:pimeloyl-ACP methyl ester carboxylesterase
MEPQPSGWEVVEVEGVTQPRRSVVVAHSASGRTPVVLVHGIIDNVWRWLTPADATAHGVRIPDRTTLVPLFDLEQTISNPLGTFPRLWAGSGLLQRLSEEQIPAVAYSYQDRVQAVACMTDAVEALHRIVEWSLRHWQTPRVDLLGHSRGGLVCRHALLTDSPAMTAERFRRSVGRLIAVCTPHQGSRIAAVAGPLMATFTQFESVGEKLGSALPAWIAPGSSWLAHVRDFITNIGQLTADSAEVQTAACCRLPELPGGYFALAGSSPAYFSCQLPMMGQLRLPPTLAIPELTDTEGDMAVSVASALDIPDAAATRMHILPLNHLAASVSPAAHNQLIAWLR